MQPECRQHPTAQPEGLSKDYSARYSRGMLSLSNYGPYKPCNPWHLSAGLVMVLSSVQFFQNHDQGAAPAPPPLDSTLSASLFSIKCGNDNAPIQITA